MSKKQVIPFIKKQNQEYEVLPDILYEIEKLLFPFDSYDRFRNEPKLLDEQKQLKRALLESQLLHARNLLGYFTHAKCSTRTIDDVTEQELPDVLTKHFRGMSAPLIGKEKKLKDRLDKTLAHISYDRISYKQLNDTEWPPVIFLPVLKGCKKFLDHLQDYLLSECTEEDQKKIPVLADVTADTIKQLEKSTITLSSMAAVTTAADPGSHTLPPIRPRRA